MDGKPEGERCVLLLSGGMDSTVLLARLRSEGWAVHALTAAYGQRHAIEIERAREQARSWGCLSHEVIVLPAVLFRSVLTDPGGTVPAGRRPDETIGIPPTYVPARNLVLLALATAHAESLGARHVFIAANSVDTSGYPDCRRPFIEAFDRAAAEGTASAVHVHAPLIDMSKADIVRLGVSMGVDFARTLSCYDPAPGGEACGRCESCTLRARGFSGAGIVDPALHAGDGR